jgi:hypothetical protein
VSSSPTVALKNRTLHRYGLSLRPFALNSTISLFFSEIAKPLVSGGRAAKDFVQDFLSLCLIRRFCSGESFIKPKENDDVEDLADLISLLHSFLDFSYILLPGCGAPPKVTFFRVILNTVI